jgi:hypothetical protein
MFRRNVYIFILPVVYFYAYVDDTNGSACVIWYIFRFS